MSLQRQAVTLQIQGGQNEKVDSKVAISPLSLVNCRYTKTGALSKRPGTSKLGRFNLRTDSTTPPAPELLCAYGDHLVRVGGGYLDSVVPLTSTDCVARGKVANAVVRRTPVAGNVYQYGDLGIGTYASRSVVIATYVEQTSATTNAVYADMLDLETGAYVLRKVFVYGTGTVANPKVTVSNGYAVISWVVGANLYVKTLNLTSLAWSAATAVATDLQTFSGTETCYDVCGVSNTLYVVYRNNGATNKVAVMTVTISTLATGTPLKFGGADTGFKLVSIEAAAGEAVYVLYVPETGGTTTPKAARIDTGVTAVATSWSFQTHTSASVPVFAGGIVRASSTERIFVWQTPDGMKWDRRNSSGVAQYSSTPRKNAGLMPISDPFVVGTGFYVVATTQHGRPVSGGIGTFLAGDAVVVELDALVGADYTGRIAGVFAHRQIDRDPTRSLSRETSATANVTVSGTTAYVGVTTGLGRDGYLGALFTGGLRFALERVTLTFDQNKPTACDGSSALVVAGGTPVTFDGEVVTECSFLHAPSFSASPAVAAGAGLTLLATYQFAATYAWYDANGDLHRSEPSLAASLTLTAANGNATLVVRNCHVTLRGNPTATAGSESSTTPWIELWRTVANGSTFYLEQRAASVINATDVTFTSTMADATLQTQEVLGTIQTDPSVPYVLPAYTPPSAAAVARIGGRIWLTDTDDGTAWYSDVIVQGEAPRFNPAWTVPPPPSGRWTAAGELDEKVVLFEEGAIWFTFGDGPDSTNQGAFAPLRAIASDIGCTDPRSLCVTPEGLFFMSRDGLALLTRGLQVVRISAGVEDTMSGHNVVAAVNVPDYAETRFVLDTADTRQAVVYDATHGNAQQPVWYRYLWSNPTGSSSAEIASACYFDGLFTFITTDGYVYQDDEAFLDGLSTWVTMQVETSNWNAGVLQGWMSVFGAGILAESTTAHDLTIDVYQDWSDTPITRSWTATELATLPRTQVMVCPSTQPSQAVRVRFTDATPSTGQAVGSGTGATLSAITLEVGVQTGIVPLAAAARK